MIHTVLNNNKFNGKYVAMKDFSDHTVVGDGATPEEAYKKAAEKGFEKTVIIFVPIKGIVQIY